MHSSDFLTSMLCFWCFWNLLILVQQTKKKMDTWTTNWVSPQKTPVMTSHSARWCKWFSTRQTWQNKWLFQIYTYSWPASRFCWGGFYLMGPEGMDRIPELHANGRLRSSHLREGDKRNQHRNGKPVPQDQAMERALWMNSLLMPFLNCLKVFTKQTNMENTKVISW